jgi:hypothetical protein
MFLLLNNRLLPLSPFHLLECVSIYSNALGSCWLSFCPPLLGVTARPVGSISSSSSSSISSRRRGSSVGSHVHPCHRPPRALSVGAVCHGLEGGVPRHSSRGAEGGREGDREMPLTNHEHRIVPVHPLQGVHVFLDNRSEVAVPSRHKSNVTRPTSYETHHIHHTQHITHHTSQVTRPRSHITRYLQATLGPPCTVSAAAG